MKKLSSLLAIMLTVAAFNVCAMGRGENVAPEVPTVEELGRRLQQQREQRQREARRLRDAQRLQREQQRLDQPRRNLNAQFEEEVGRGEMDVD